MGMEGEGREEERGGNGRRGEGGGERWEWKERGGRRREVGMEGEGREEERGGNGRRGEGGGERWGDARIEQDKCTTVQLKLVLILLRFSALFASNTVTSSSEGLGTTEEEKGEGEKEDLTCCTKLVCVRFDVHSLAHVYDPLWFASLPERDSQTPRS